jgi:hypothetical protein
MKHSIDNGADEQLVTSHKGRAVTVHRWMRRLPSSLEASGDDDAISLGDFLTQMLQRLLPSRIR